MPPTPSSTNQLQNQLNIVQASKCQTKSNTSCSKPPKNNSSSVYQVLKRPMPKYSPPRLMPKCSPLKQGPKCSQVSKYSTKRITSKHSKVSKHQQVSSPNMASLQVINQRSSPSIESLQVINHRSIVSKTSSKASKSSSSKNHLHI